MEQRWQLTAASAGQQLGVIALGVLNLCGVVALTFMLQASGSILSAAVRDYMRNCGVPVRHAL